MRGLTRVLVNLLEAEEMAKALGCGEGNPLLGLSLNVIR